MKETVFKVEVNDEIVDMLQIRIQEKIEIEIFVLTQALGLFELLERRVILTSQCKKSVLAATTRNALMEMKASEEVIRVIDRSAKLQGAVLEVTDEVVEEAKILKEETVRLLADRLKVEQDKKREWVELFDYDVKTLREMHDKAMARQQKEIEEMVRKREMRMMLDSHFD